jgi:hypothetical protein
MAFRILHIIVIITGLATEEIDLLSQNKFLQHLFPFGVTYSTFTLMKSKEKIIHDFFPCLKKRALNITILCMCLSPHNLI